jgi:hypothetical protein
MAQPLYCWRCDMVLPMLDEEEWARLSLLLMPSRESLERYQRDYGLEVLKPPLKEWFKPALALYQELTGFEETVVGALWHHRLSLYGPPCTHCGKPLRTPQAKLCAACGTVRA